MKRTSILGLITLLAGSVLCMAGCNDETKPDQAVLDSMNKQRAAMPAGGSPTTPAPPAKK